MYAHRLQQYIKSIVAVSVYRDIEYKGGFNCSDERLNEIYSVARKTCHLNMQSMLWDGIKRDRMVWIGDMHPEMLTIKCVFGDDECIEEGMAFAVNQFVLPEYINLKPSYSLWFVIILHDWYIQNKNVEFVGKYLKYVSDLFENLDALVDEDGEMHLKGYFFDWPTHDTSDSNRGGSTESKIGVKALFLIALDCAVSLYSVFGKDASLLLNLKEKLLRKKLPAAKTKQALAFSVLSGQREFDGGVAAALTRDGAAGFSTFMSYYILKALADNGYVKEAVDIMKEYFGAMIDRGATTFWEDFDMKWLIDSGRIDCFPEEGQKDIHGDFGGYCYTGFRRSLCHGWASGAVPFMTEYILGVRVEEAGCKKIAIRPNLLGLSYASGDYPTPYGVIHIEHKAVNGKIESVIEAPKEIEIIR